MAENPSLDDFSVDVTPLSEGNPTPRGTAPVDENQPDPIVAEARRRFQYVVETEAYARANFLQDYKFAEADSDNGYQWPNDLRKNRDIDDRPCLTINITRQHNLQIINDAKQNKMGGKVVPRSGGASQDSAQIYQDLIRHIEYISNAQRAYDKANEFQVKAGFGFWRLVTDYANEETFDQEIFIRPIPDPLSAYLDPDCKEADKSDANYGFIYQNMSKAIAETLYPDWKGDWGTSPLGSDQIFWVGRDHVKFVEYFRKIQIPDELLAYNRPEDGALVQTRASEIGPELTAQLKEQAGPLGLRVRPVWRTQVEWHLIVGGKRKASRRWLGKYIPLIMAIGEETVIDGVLDRKGHTRAMKDPQRIYNYWSSAAVEQVALQTKTPYTGPAAAIEGYETYWNRANSTNASYLPYKHLDDEGNPLQSPTRVPPPEMAQAFVQGISLSATDMAKVSGQYESQFGQESNERTGRAISERQRQGKNATYHFIDNMSMAVTLTTKMLLDLIPKVYDTARVLQLTAEDGSTYELMVDPQAAQALQVRQNLQGEAVARIFNPKLGAYDVVATVGPDYATRREEAWNAYSIILTQAPQLVGVIGDLLFRAGDFPFAEEAAARLKRMVPAQAKEGGPSAEMLTLQQQLQNTSNALASCLNELAIEKGKNKDKDRDLDIGEYDAETKRITALLKLIDGDKSAAGGAEKSGLKALVDQLVADALETHITKPGPMEQTSLPVSAPKAAPQPAGGGTGIPGMHQMNLAPPVPGASMAPDGNWYLPDPERQGKYLKVLGGA